MSAYLIGQINIKDEQLWQQYVAGVGESLTPYNAKIVMRGQLHQKLAGEANFTTSVVISFDTIEHLQLWYASANYQALIPLRDNAAEVTINSYTSLS